MTTTTKLFTAEDLWELPTDEPWEIWEGELRKVPGAGGEASNIALVIAALLFPTVRAGNLGMLTGADGTYILARDPDTVRAPDAAFVRAERIAPGRLPETYWPGPPDVAFEVTSPNDRPPAVEAKALDWLAAGTLAVVVLDPRRRVATVYRSRSDVRALAPDELLDLDPELPGFSVVVAALFG